eukprot:CAMPEP_0113484572 /NCGR_PEP_ID=MMETSP0014_2-20120614/24030_1 /TAXON_ID=2857 /ORGANISM="Nitzschia sp." /LENGTH=357 /DNA_ID=CAMNT_0000378177 /DNA_START=423 /DNA_END=1496 /DNA_ORIENTATION=- /assembly_acc=CAM_ASM_000159
MSASSAGRSSSIHNKDEYDTKSSSASTNTATTRMNKPPLEVVLEPPSLLARYACASVMVAIFAVWGKVVFVPDEMTAPGIGTQVHSWVTPAILTSAYLLLLPVLRHVSRRYLSEEVDVKVLLKETMVVYNGGQVLLNGWMVYRFIDSLVNKGHPFIGDLYTVQSGTTFAVWVHYMDKYLEFFDTFFMVLRGRMDQVSFLHVYHHVSIAWAWWFAMVCYPGGDAYFGALLNSWIHVMMYSYYTLSLLKFSCPWKKYLTQAQLLQFTSVVIYTGFSVAIQLRQRTAEPRHYACFAVQTFEMVSLFFLFMHFYSKAYKKKKSQMKVTSEVESTDTSMTEQVSISSESSDDAQNLNGKKEL